MSGAGLAASQSTPRLAHAHSWALSLRRSEDHTSFGISRRGFTEDADIDSQPLVICAMTPKPLKAYNQLTSGRPWATQ